MSRMESAVKLLAQFYEARDAMKLLFGDKYEARVALWRKTIQGVMERLQCSEIEAALEILKRLDARGINGGISIPLILATVVEMVEGRK